MKRETETRLRVWILTVAYLALIFGISSIPQAPLSATCIKVSDKLAHMAEYAGFGVLLTLALRRTLSSVRLWVVLLMVVGLGAGVGALDETYQLTVPGRETELLDWVADVAGILVGYLVAAAFYMRSRGTPQEQQGEA